MVSLAGDTVAVSTTDFAMSQKDCEFIAKIQGVIAEQLADENFSIDTLAEQMNMSRSNFYRKIKALSGMRFHRAILCSEVANLSKWRSNILFILKLGKRISKNFSLTLWNF
jgi:AraC-like DNA-binding protein